MSLAPAATGFCEHQRRQERQLLGSSRSPVRNYTSINVENRMETLSKNVNNSERNERLRGQKSRYPATMELVIVEEKIENNHTEFGYFKGNLPTNSVGIFVTQIG